MKSINSAAKRRISQADWHLSRLLLDEDAFLARASVHDLTRAVLYFREQAARATSPQLRDFFLDRANQFAFRSAATMRIHSSARR